MLVARRDLPKPPASPTAESSASALYVEATTGEASSVVEAPLRYPADVKLGLQRYRDQLKRRRAILAKAKTCPGHGQQMVRTLNSERQVLPPAPLTIVRKHLGNLNGPSTNMLSLPRPVLLPQVRIIVCPSHRLSPR